jgi:hypothetical protein
VKIAIRIACGMMLGLLLSSIYWLPAALESKYVYEWASELMPYHATYLTLLESQNTFGFIINSSFTLIVAAITLSAWALRATEFKGEPFVWGKKYAGDAAYSQIRLWIILGVAAIFMSTTFSMHISKLIPRIDAATPAWRWLAIAALFASLLVGAAVERLTSSVTQSTIKLWAMRASMCAMIILSLWITAKYVIIEAVQTRQSYTFSPNHMDSGFTPKNSTPPDSLPDTPLAVLEPQSGASEVVRWEPQQRELIVFAEQPGELRLKTYNFPGWIARIDGQATPVSSDKDGAQVIAIPAGKHKVETEFVNTPPRKMGIALASIGLLTIFGLTLADRLQWWQRRANDSDRNEERAKRGRLAIGLRNKYVVVGLSIVVCALAVVMISRLSNRRSATASGKVPAAGSEAERAARGSIVVGSEIRVYLEGLDTIPVAVDEKALDELIIALSKKDGAGVDALAQSGRVIKVVRNTSARVMQMETGKTKVRISEGQYIMQEGWVLDRWVR